MIHELDPSLEALLKRELASFGKDRVKVLAGTRRQAEGGYHELEREPTAPLLHTLQIRHSP